MAAGAKVVEHTDAVLTRAECDFLIAEVERLRAERDALAIDRDNVLHELRAARVALGERVKG